VDCGDILEVSKKIHFRGNRFDTICAFDLWEHLHPQRLHEYIEAMVALAKNDALFFFAIPAFGDDKVFGEIFPLQLEENRDKFDRRLPFDFLNAESLSPIIPTNGHLIWAHTEWWQNQFEKHKMVRLEELEKKIHFFFDDHLFYARKSFYIFRYDSPKAKNRTENLLRLSYSFFQKWKFLREMQIVIEDYQNGNGGGLIDSEGLRATIHHAELQMIQEMESRRQQWDQNTSFLYKKWIRIASLFSKKIRQDRRELDDYVTFSERLKYSKENSLE
jgi:hypothetical protein